MSEINKPNAAEVVDELQFRALSRGSIVVYEKSVRTYDSTGKMVSGVIQSFNLAYTVYYCKLTNLALVTFELREIGDENGKVNEELSLKFVHQSCAEVFKVESRSRIHELTDDFLDGQRFMAVNRVRALLAKRHPKSPPLPQIDDSIVPDEIPF